MEQHTIIVDKNGDGGRLDLTILSAGLGYSRGKIRRIIEVGGTYVNRKRVRIAGRRVKEGDRIELDFDPAFLSAKDLSLVALQPEAILLEQGGILALNKPPGMPAQATRQQAVFHVLAALKTLLGMAEEPLLVHRLDKETSGVMLVARTPKVADFLTGEFKEHRVRKSYHALVHGLPPFDEIEIAAKLSGIDRTGLVRVDEAKGAAASTHVTVLHRFTAPGMALLLCQPLTGRTHQIRVHLKHIGFPIVGDKRYGLRHASLPEAVRELATVHHMLHAYELKFRPAADLPPLTLRASYPPAFQQILAWLKTL